MVLWQQTLTSIGRAWVGCLVLLALSSGCATTNLANGLEPPPKGIPGQIVATWNKDVQFLPDRVNNGRMTPALTGRVYLFEVGKIEPKPIVADGSLFISLYDEHGRTAPDGTPIALEVWQITPDCMKQVITKDWCGWGYTLNLPWNTYRPDVGQVRFQVRYVPPKDAKDPMPVFSDSPVLALQHPGNSSQATAVVNARNPLGVQPNASRYTQPAPETATSWQGSIPVHRNPLAGGPSINAGNAQGTTPTNSETSPVLVPVSAVGQPAGVQSPALSGPSAPQTNLRYPQALPQMNNPAPQVPAPTSSTAADASGSTRRVVEATTIEPRAPVQGYSSGAFTKAPVAAGGLPGQMPLKGNNQQVSTPVNNASAQPMGPAIDNGSPAPMQQHGVLPPPPTESAVAYPQPPVLPPAPAPAQMESRFGDAGSPAPRPARNAPMPGQMLSIPGGNPQ
jgi:hypothetical protein